MSQAGAVAVAVVVAAVAAAVAAVVAAVVVAVVAAAVVAVGDGMSLLLLATISNNSNSSHLPIRPIQSINLT